MFIEILISNMVRSICPHLKISHIFPDGRLLASELANALCVASSVC
jgi:hypothetical protein